MTRARFMLLFALALPATALVSCSDKETVRGKKELSPKTEHDGGAEDDSSRGRPAIQNEAQAVQVLLTTNDGEVREGKIAATKAIEPDVKSFAEGIVREHTAANERLKAILERTGIQPEVTPTSDRMKFDSDSAVNHLNQMTESMFDRAFVTRQVNLHRTVLSLVDEEIVPVIVNADLRQEVGKQRAMLQQHMEHAESILNELPTGTPPPDAGLLPPGEDDAGTGGDGGLPASPLDPPGVVPEAGAL